ncbi:MAG TPA: hypothetical protein P5572_00965 [Phycisphaerae bacterium]|nr:hypothetical protein [Phycisphaerales bacterium]HRX83569.1 hypothetical protein [Phycisphaerae bacterium]
MTTPTSRFRAVTCSACLAAALLGLAANAAPGCADGAEERAAATPASAAPAATPAPSSAPSTGSEAPAASPDASGEKTPIPPAPPPLAVESTPPPPLKTGWATLTEHDDAQKRAWVEGEVVNGDEFTINTSNVRRFTLDLTCVRLDWSKRIVLRMDGFNSQLTRKRWPTLHFVRTSAGAWDVEAD